MTSDWRVYLHLVSSGKWLYTNAQGISYPGGICLPYYSSSVVKVGCVLLMLCYLIKKFELNFCKFSASHWREHACILSYIPTKICHDEAVMFLLSNQKIIFYKNYRWTMKVNECCSELKRTPHTNEHTKTKKAFWHITYNVSLFTRTHKVHKTWWLS